MTIFNSYNRIRGDLESIFRSRLIIQILLSLGQKGQTLTELREITGSSSQAIIPIIRKLEFRNLIKKVDNEYYLTTIGLVMDDKISELFSFLSVINTHKDFFKEHYLEAIPFPFLQEIDVLDDSILLVDTQAEIYSVYVHFLKIVQEAKWIYGISSIMSIGHAKALAKRVKDKINIELVVNEEVILQLQSEPYKNLITELLEYDNFKIYQYPGQIKLGLIISDTDLSLGLYKADMKIYDTTSDIVSKNPSAIAWGERLFYYYKDKSTLSKIIDF